MNEFPKNNGGGFLSVLFFIFLIMKLTDKIDWSWWWVISPLWIPIAIISLIGLVLLIAIVIAKIVRG